MDKHTPGPLTVKVCDEWPFHIQTLNAAGDVVFSRHLPAYSTRQESAKQAMAGKFMGDTQAEAAAANQKALADEILRAAAPELLEALEVICNSIETTNSPWRESSMHTMALNAIAKAQGQS